MTTYDFRFRPDLDGKPTRPAVPAEVRALCSYLKIFKDPLEARKLIPLLYVYWS